MKRAISGWLFLLLSLAGYAQADTYKIRNGLNDQPPCVGGSWTRNNSLYICSGRVVLASGDILDSNQDITIKANGGFQLGGSNVIGDSKNTIALVSDYGDITAQGAANTFSASVTSSSGAINLAGSTVAGDVQSTSGAIAISASSSIAGNVTGGGSGSFSNSSVGGDTQIGGSLTASGSTFSGNLSTDWGTVNLTGGSVGGNLLAGGNITTNGSSVTGSLTSTNGSVNLTGGTIGGLVRSGCCVVATSNTNLQNGARSDSSGLSISGGSIQGDFYSAGNAAVFASVTMTSGTVSGASTVTFTGSTLGSTSASVTVTSVSGAVTLNDTTAYGSFTAPSYSTIYVNGSSRVTGVCLPGSTPANACQTVTTPTCLADDFNRSALDPSNWAVTSRNGSFGVPKIVGNRLRLTDNSGNVATGATLQRLVPASANFVQVQFKYYAYGGNGADGVAVTFSDATQTPQPGGYGGSLGYAQNGSISGFSGGWLAVALDEYGNFSNPTEGRVGGPGFRQDSVSVRGSGSGTTGYRYLAGTAANLSPGIDISGGTAGPGHTYRITLDNTVAGKAMLKVERNTGAGFTTLVSSFDVLASSGQAALPANFYLTFTGSTGGSNNIHELDDLQVCATRMDPVGQQIDHYEFVHAGNALTCNPLSVEVRACLNADCSLRHTDPVSVTLSPSGWEGGSSRTFSGGTLVDNLRVTTAQTVTLGVSNSSPPLKALSQTLCKVGAAPLSTNCSVAFADSGFIFDVPTLLARKEQTGIALQAVRKDNATQRCVPAFGPATRTLQFWSDYVDPGTGSMAVQVNDTAVSGNAASPTNLSLTFDSQAKTQLKVRYDDAGLMQLNARFDGTGLESGLVMTGTDQFVSMPYGLHIFIPKQDSACSAATVDDCAALSVEGQRVAAGDNFQLSIRAVAWQADEDRTAAALSDNPPTPNFELASIGLTGTLVAPTPAEGGVAGSFYRHNADGSRTVLASYDHVRGASTDLTVSQGEVGIFQLTATPVAGSYHGQTVGGGTSALIGRFTPAYLGVTSSASLAPACGAFSYQGQLIGFAGGQPQIAVTGFNRQGAVTRNYDRGAFWRLAPPQRQPYSLIAAGRPNLAARLQSLGDAESLAIVDSGAADGRRAFDWRADGVRPADALRWQLPSPPADEDLPLVLTAAGEHVRLRVEASELTDLDGTCYGSGGACQDFEHAFGGTELRLGRLRLDAASGPQNQALDLPYWLESWQSQGGSSVWGETLGDTCSTPAALGQVVLSGFSGGLQASDFPTPPGSLEAPPVATPTPSGVVRLPAPNKSGSVLATLSGLNGASPALPWLWFDWNGDGTPEAASARATFGVQAVQRALIFRRELYRQ